MLRCLKALRSRFAARPPADVGIEGLAATEPVAPPPDAPTVDFHGTWARGCFVYASADDDGRLIWPQDPDEVPLWRIEREMWAEQFGLGLPSYRTRRECESAEAELNFRLAADHRPHLAEPLVLSVEDAASRFLDRLRHAYDVRELSADDVSRLYLDHCEEEGLHPAAIDQVKKVLPKLPGVFKNQLNNYDERGRRHRTVQWIILPQADVAGLGEVEVLPDVEWKIAA